MEKGNIASSYLTLASVCLCLPISPAVLALILTPHVDRWFSYLPTLGEGGQRESNSRRVPSLSKIRGCVSALNHSILDSLEFKILPGS